MTGFAFQITQALLETIRAEDSEDGFALMEVLSDTVRRDGGLIVSQLKHTLSSGALHSALDELWQIEALARSVTPGLRLNMRYEVQAARHGLKDVAKSIEGWTPKNADPLELREFKQRVRAVVVSDPRLEAARLLVDKFVDPTPFQTVDQFAGLLLRAADSKTMESASKEVRVRLAALRAAACDRSADFSIWGATDRPPLTTALEPDPKKAVRVGQRLTIADLVSGRLADRKIFRSLHLATEEWLASLSDGSDKIPAFWIEGRSGAGKSAALLHLLAKVHEHDPQRLIVWLGPRSERVGQVFRRFRDAISEGRQLIIAMDDPLAPDQQDEFIAAVQIAADEWTRLSGSGDRDVSPLPPCIICCGPTEQREYGEDTCNAELEIQPWALLKESAEDVAELTDWFTKRTGRAPPDLEGDILLVQRFFEWEQGNVRDFALRFKSRLEGLGASGSVVFDLVARVLAFGRLYADYPASVLQSAIDADPLVGRAFDRLAEEETHLTFRAEGEGVRLTHPHLADAIYREWFGRNIDSRLRKSHLAEGIRAALSHQDHGPGVRLAPLWAIARLTRAPKDGRALLSDLRERLTLIEAEVHELLPEIYNESFLDRSPTDLPVWLLLDQSFGLNLSPSPAARLLEIIERADVPAQGLRLCCHVLLGSGHHLGDRDMLLSIANLLHRLSDWRDDDGLPWRDWAFVAADLIRRGGASNIFDDVLKLIERAPHWAGLRVVVAVMARRATIAEAVAVTASWLTATQDTPHNWVMLLRVLHDRNLPIPDLGERSFRFLVAAPRHRAWPSIWQLTLDSGAADRDGLIELGLGWLGVRREHGLPVAGFETDDYHKVLVAILNAGPPDQVKSDLLNLGLQWIEASPQSVRGWSAIWAVLWEENSLSREDYTNLRATGLTALGIIPSLREWSFIWHAFVRAPRSQPIENTFDIGLDWLSSARPDHSGWVYVWETLNARLSSRHPSATILRDLGDQWLLNAPAHRGWHSIWEKRREFSGRKSARMIQVGRDWLLQASPQHPSWRFVARVIISGTLKGSTDAEFFAEAAKSWLLANAQDRNWPEVFQNSVHILAPNEVARLEAEALDRARRDGGIRPQLIKAVLKGRQDHPRRQELLLELAAWLPDHFDVQEWNMGWTLLANSEDSPLSHDALLDLADRWAETADPLSKGWPHFWVSWRYFLRRFRPERVQALAPDALRCLMTLPLTHGLWPVIWRNLKYDAPELLVADVVLDRQLEWLHQPVRHTERWIPVFAGYVRHRTDWSSDNLLVERGRDAFETATGEEQHWPDLWRALHSLNRNDDTVVTRAIAWLDGPMDRPGWALLWRLVVRSPDVRRSPPERLALQGEQWLAENIEHADASKVEAILNQFVRAKPSSADRQIAELLANPESKSALGTWLRFQRRKTAPAALSEKPILKEILKHADTDQPGWSHAWATLSRQMAQEDATVELGQKAAEWLQGPTLNLAPWPWVWKDVWTWWPELRGEISPVGRNWLRGRPFNAGRAFVQKTLFGSPTRKKKAPEA